MATPRKQPISLADTLIIIASHALFDEYYVVKITYRDNAMSTVKVGEKTKIHFLTHKSIKQTLTQKLNAQPRQ